MVAAVSLLLYLAERGAECAVVLHYFLVAQYLWAGWSLALLLPGCFIQALSFVWYRKDGHPGCLTLALVHVLQLGILKRHVGFLWDAFRGRGEEPQDERELLMQEGDLTVLRLLETLLQSLPQLLLQTFIYLTLDQTDVYAVICALLCLLSVSWALVSYSRFLCLLKPGHLCMPWAALLCQLLWRMGMIGTRAMALVVFARVYHFWVFAVGGAHWLVMSFWLVAQQTDVISRPWRWRLFNVFFGAVYVFCFINVRAGPSRCRVAIFYAIMLVENCILLLLATDFLQEALWSNVKLSVAVMSGFIIGCAALIIYYTLLHPKSTEISQSFRKMNKTFRSRRRRADESYSSRCSRGAAGRDVEDTFGGVDQKLKETDENRESDVDPEGLVTWMGKTKKHHHWLLLKLAMKTGNVSKINAAFGGDGIFGDFFSPGCPNATHPLVKKYGVSADYEKWAPPDSGIMESERLLIGKIQVEDDLGLKGSPHESSSYVTLGNTRGDGELGLKGAEDITYGGDGVGSDGIPSPRATEDINTGGSPSNRDGMQENATLYFSATTEGILHSEKKTDSVLEKHKSDLGESAGTPIKEVSEKEENQTEAFPGICVSPILSLAADSNFQRSVAPDNGSVCNDSTLSNDDIETDETGDTFGVKGHPMLTVGGIAPSLRGRLVQEEKPCFTSTPKSQPTCMGLGLREETKARRKLA
ncbi:XK-related protein 5 [Rhinophrynus dorsalis]